MGLCPPTRNYHCHKVLKQIGKALLYTSTNNLKMANSMKDNKAVKMLKAAEEGGYGVVGVVSVSIPILTCTRDDLIPNAVQPRDHNSSGACC